MKKTHAFGLYLSPLIALIAIGVLWVTLIKPQVIALIQRQIPAFNQSQDKVEVVIQHMDISLLKLQMTAEDIQLSFKNDLKDMSALEVGGVKAQLDPFKLLVGQISLSKIQIDRANWSFKIPAASNQASPELPMEEIFKLLPQIPVEKVFISRSNFKLIEPRQKIEIDFSLPYLAISNQKNRITLSTQKTITIEASHEKKKSISAQLATEFTLREKTLDVAKLEVSTLDSSLNVSGQISQINRVLINPQAKFQFNGDVHFDNIRSIGLSLFPQKTRFPMITGSVKVSGAIDLKAIDNINGQVTVQTTQVSIDHFKLGQAQVQAEIKKNQIFINQIDVEHPAALASLNHIEIQQTPPYAFKAQLDLKSFDLQKLFISLGLNNIPAGVLGNGEAQCEGSVDPTFTLNCDTKMQMRDIWVKTDLKTDYHIVKLKQASVNGKVTLTPEQASYQTELRVGSSQGTSSGVVKFSEGFKINYETNHLSFNDVEDLAGLGFKGDLKIKGTTSGDSNAGVIDALATFTNAEISQFKLGQLTSALIYEKGHLYLNQVTGQIGKSKYAGSLDFNFLKSNLNATLSMPQMQGEDVLMAIGTRFPLPFEITGAGSARILLDGPFDFWKLNYDLKAQLNQGQIAGESYDHLQLNLAANGERIQFSNVYLKKPRSTLVVDGFINTKPVAPEFNLKLKGEPVYLDEVDHLTKLAPAVSGQVWIDGFVSGNLNNPELAFNFNAKQINFENTDYPGSQGRVTIDKNYFKFNGQVLGRQIQSDIEWPWNANSPFSIKMQIHDLNPLVFLPLISLPQPNTDFSSKVNASIDLHSSTRSFQNADGEIRIDNFILYRGAQSLKLVRPSYLSFKNGLHRLEPFELKGEDSSLLVQMNSVKSDEIRLTVMADLQLRLFQFLVPFTQTLGGRLELDSQVLVKDNGFELFGDGELTDGIVGFKGFPLPIDNINTPVEFSKSKILLSDITAQLGQSEVTGAGQIDIRGPRDIAVNLQAEADNIELTFPEQMTTAGRAEISFTGNWLPYTAKINYKVSRGLIEKNFGEDTSGKTTLISSPYLPPQQAEQQIPSLMLDVTVDMSQGVVVKNALLEGEAVGVLRITNTPENPLITGRIDITAGSKFFFKDKPFDIQTATIIFPPAKEINPNIYITANARVSDYDVSLLIQGPAKNLLIKPTSQPPLTEPDLFNLLALGVTTTQLDQNISSETQQQQTGLEVLAAIGNQSAINKKIQQKLGLTVQLAPTVDSTKNIAVPKVVVSRKLQKNVNASYSRPLTGDTQESEWKLQYLFNPNKSVILNYQNKESNQQDQIRNNTTNETGILGLDFEYKREFKW